MSNKEGRMIYQKITQSFNSTTVWNLLFVLLSFNIDLHNKVVHLTEMEFIY